MKLNKYQEKFIKRVLDHAEKMHNEGNKEIAAMLKTIKENYFAIDLQNKKLIQEKEDMLVEINSLKKIN